MRTTHAVLAAIATTAVLSGPSAFAQTNGGSSGQFITQESDNQWRGSKLIGINVYDPNNEKIGSIIEILTNTDGNPEVAVIGVGGFLGLGAKDVGLPFKALKWSNESVVPPAPATSPPAAGTPGATPTAPPTAPPTTAPGVTRRVNVKQDYPDHAVLDMTKDQLTNAPDFKFAGSNAAPSTSR